MNKSISNVAAIVIIGMLGIACAAHAASVASATPAGENPTSAIAG